MKTIEWNTLQFVAKFINVYECERVVFFPLDSKIDEDLIDAWL